MILDSSAIVAVLGNEPEAKRIAASLADSRVIRISAGTLLEVAILVDRHRYPRLSDRLDELLELHEVTIEPVTARHVTIARRAYREYGRGSGHPAGLNFGDCFAYALAKEHGEPLLYVGDDFSHTDVASALG